MTRSRVPLEIAQTLVLSTAATERGCVYVLFDADGTTLPQFPTYDW